MRKNKYLLLAFLMAFAANSSVWSMGEQKAFSVEAELVKEYAEKVANDHGIDDDYCAKKLEAKEIFFQWDKLLNDVYKYLKNHLAATDFENVKQQQRAWIKEKEAQANSAAKANAENSTRSEYEKYNVYNTFTAKRCEELIAMVIDDKSVPAVSKTDAQLLLEKYTKKVEQQKHYSESIYNEEILNQLDLNQQLYRNYQQWNNLMGEIIYRIRENTNETVMSKITEEQDSWEKEANKKAEAEAEQWSGGSGAAMAEFSSRCSSWQERCEALLKNMKEYVVDVKTPSDEKAN